MKIYLSEDARGGLHLVVATTPRGAGYMRPLWTDRNKGPGNATQAGQDCGHAGLDHCNSGHCRRWFCRLPRTRLGRLLLQGHTMRVYLGPAPRLQSSLKGYLFNLRLQVHAMDLALRVHPHMTHLYSLVSVR